MRTSNCLICCATGPVEGHHVAGRRNAPDLVVDLCVECHRIVTAWQHAAGIRLKSGPRAQVDIARARIVGALHLLELFMHRHPDAFAVSPAVTRLITRLVSGGLDGAADPSRPGRWTPDPTEVYRIAAAPAHLTDEERAAAFERFQTTFEALLDQVAFDEVAAELGWARDWRDKLVRAIGVAAIAVGLGYAHSLREVAA